MKIRLDVTEKTFTNYLIDIGFNYKIKQYDDFINSIKRNIQTILINNINNNFEQLISFIFGEDRNLQLSLITNIEKITYTTSDFLKSIIEDGSLEIFFEENKTKLYSQEIQEEAYFYECLLNTSLSKYTKEAIRDIWLSNGKITLQKCIATKSIYLTDQEKTDIYKEVYNKIIRHEIYTPANFSKIKKLYNNINIMCYPYIGSIQEFELIMVNLITDIVGEQYNLTIPSNEISLDIYIDGIENSIVFLFNKYLSEVYSYYSPEERLRKAYAQINLIKFENKAYNREISNAFSILKDYDFNHFNISLYINNRRIYIPINDILKAIL